MAPDFSKMTTDDLLQIIPPTETTEWEFKAAAIFDPSRFGEFKKQKLGKIVSSFANSGGGYLLLGKQDGVTTFDHVPTHEGRTTMEDHLSLVISQSVAPHYRNFEIRRLPISGRPNESVLVVEFFDSPAAPHQSVADVNYFYRLPGHSVPAPHFHLELLRGRLSKTILEVKEVQYVLTSVDHNQNQPLCLHVALNVTVENTSLLSATAWGLHLKQAHEYYGWSEESTRRYLFDGVCCHSDRSVLLPNEQITLTVRLKGEADPRQQFRQQWEGLARNLALEIRPVSQNFVGTPTQFEMFSSRHRLEDEITQFVRGR
ncbi:Divergent AAA domain protein [Anatilimnocola aggregata]|uniref:Divergent AAA domain protein n=1 Tax=Anatilimnocola aggregata TaxID=2528021 RepID=A0A517YH47_9BACT|nr:ATP-binding protein [Anatilimnocola aggregata]QDU29566.1 Divergent AAA domain protein [Anatilimnocola aggregata]